MNNDIEAPGRRLVRGGAFCDPAWDCRCAVRYGLDPHYRYVGIGFRVVSSTFPKL